MRVRFAPSPTGQLHVGNARTALFNWLLARGQGGTLVLRVEDTDAERSTRESERTILEDLRWLGLDWDEGLDRGGPYGPYRQSERLHVYRAHAVELVATGHAYQCFCSPAQLEADREAARAAGRPPMYGGRCRSLTREEARARVAGGEPAVVRLRVPDNRDVTFDDVVRGRVSVSTTTIGDPVLLRSDGTPAYNFAVVVDDALMAVTHVVRGEDHLSNTPRQVLLYDAFGWRPPVFAHVSLVMGPDHSPLSKRHGATSVAEFRARGILPEALANYLALLGWSPGGGEERLPLDELARRFRLQDVGQSAGVFDPEKLAWFNRQYLREVAPERLASLVVPYLRQRQWLGEPTPADLEYLGHVVPPVSPSVDAIEQVPDRLAFLFDYSAAGMLAVPERRAEVLEARAVVEALADELASAAPLVDRDAFRSVASRVGERAGRKGKGLFHPIRLVLTGEGQGLELDVAIPAIERGARLEGSGLRPIASAAARAAAVARLLSGS